MDSKTAPEYLPPRFPEVPSRLGYGTNRGYYSIVAAVLTAAVLTTGLIAAAIIFRGDGHGMVTCPAAGNQVAQPLALSANKVKRADLKTGKGDHLTEGFDYDRQSNTVLIDSPANISDNSAAAAIAVDFDQSVMFMSFTDSNTCIGLAIDDEFALKVRDYVDGNDNDMIDISSVAFDIENYRLVGRIPPAYLQATNGPVIRGLCAGRYTFWALPVSAEEHERLRREVDCGIFRACVCLLDLCGCKWVIGCYDMDELRNDGWLVL